MTKYLVQYQSNLCGIQISGILLTGFPDSTKKNILCWPETQLIATWKITLKPANAGDKTKVI